MAEASAEGANSPRLLTYLVALAAFMGLLDASIVNVSLPHLAEELGTTLSAVSWVGLAYRIALADRHGFRRVYLAESGVFTAASLPRTLAPGHRAPDRVPPCPGGRGAAMLQAIGGVMIMTRVAGTHASAPSGCWPEQSRSAPLRGRSLGASSPGPRSTSSWWRSPRPHGPLPSRRRPAPGGHRPGRMRPAHPRAGEGRLDNPSTLNHARPGRPRRSHAVFNFASTGASRRRCSSAGSPRMSLPAARPSSSASPAPGSACGRRPDRACRLPRRSRDLVPVHPLSNGIVERGHLSLDRVAAVTSEGPAARCLGCYPPRKGAARDRPVMRIANGETIVEDGAFAGERGVGSFVAREPSWRLRFPGFRQNDIPGHLFLIQESPRW